MKTIIGVTANNTTVYDATALGAHPHGDITPFIEEAISKTVIPEGITFFRTSINLNKTVGVDHLVSTNSASIIKYMQRGNRPGKTRFTMNQSAEPTSIINLIFCLANEGDFNNEWVLWTAFAGSLGEREPFDSNLHTEEEKAKAEAFWQTHALVPTDEERKLLESM